MVFFTVSQTMYGFCLGHGGSRHAGCIHCFSRFSEVQCMLTTITIAESAGKYRYIYLTLRCENC